MSWPSLLLPQSDQPYGLHSQDVAAGDVQLHGFPVQVQRLGRSVVLYVEPVGFLLLRRLEDEEDGAAGLRSIGGSLWC